MGAAKWQIYAYPHILEIRLQRKIQKNALEGSSGSIVFIDEISGGNMRAFRNGRQIPPLELARLILGE